MDISGEDIRRAYNLPEYVDQIFEDNLFVMHNRELYPWVIFFETMCIPGKEVV